MLVEACAHVFWADGLFMTRASSFFVRFLSRNAICTLIISIPFRNTESSTYHEVTS
jgi:hypothetical protein